MPMYDFECIGCGKTFEAFKKIEDKDTQKCFVCGEETKTLISCTYDPANFCFEKYDEGLDRMVTGPQHRKTIMMELQLQEL